MELGLNGATIMRSRIEDDIDIAAECGFGALEFWSAKLDAYVAENRSLVRLAERICDRGLQPSCINSIEDITCRDEHGRKALLNELRRRVTMARELRAPAIVVVPSCLDSPMAATDAIGDAVQVLRAMSDVAGDVRLAFEFLGKRGCTVPRLDMAIEIIDRVDRPNVGLVLDVFHFYAGRSALDDLRHVPVDRLLMVHLNDAEDVARRALTDADRVYPGEGVIPLASILGTLNDRGYDGMASVELFRPAYWEDDPRIVAATAFERARSVMQAAGYTLHDRPSGWT